ncbi:MAG TPA: hypothetical protein VEC57_07720 [Candidatus Limnocylindrales bacterium]|nr:hypothetical protein [Candidatus Limnocylindrales bacterium]
MLLRAFAVAFALLALSNLLKPFELIRGEGFVFLGRRLTGAPNFLAAWSFAAFLGAYASSLWNAQARALAMGLAYAGFVSANLFLFALRGPAAGAELHAAGIAYIVVALAGSWGAVAAMVQREVGTGEPAAQTVLRAFALLFALMALSNLLKPFAYTETVGFVLLGERLSGTANVAAALFFSAFLAAYALAIWTGRRAAVGMGIAYAIYVALNLALWNVRKPEGADTPLLFALPYLLTAIGVSSGAAVLLWRQRHRLT